MIGIKGRKIGMTQLFREDGKRISVSLIEVAPCPIIQVKTKEKDGYNAIQIGFGQKRERLISKPMKGHLKKSKVKSVRGLEELRVDSTEPYKTGEVIDISMFQAGDFVDVTGITIGKGFQGGVKRWNWGGGKKSHGSMHHRQVGSVGASSYPSRIFKGHHMPGRMGGKKKTIQNLEVIKVDKDKQIMAIKGSVPGNENVYLLIRIARKKPRKNIESEGNKNDQTKK